MLEANASRLEASASKASMVEAIARFAGIINSLIWFKHWCFSLSGVLGLRAPSHHLAPQWWADSGAGTTPSFGRSVVKKTSAEDVSSLRRDLQRSTHISEVSIIG